MKKYDQFINESNQDVIYMYDIFNSDLTIDKVKELKNIIQDSTYNPLEESISSLWNKFEEYISRRAWKWLINKNERDLTKKLKYLNMLDLEDLSDCKPVTKMYLGGGIDKAVTGNDDWISYVEKDI